MNEQLQVILESLSVFWISPVKDTLAGLLWCVFIASVGGLIYLLIQRQTLGRFLTALMREGCETPESAKSLKELNLHRLPQSRGRWIGRVEGEEERYFLPEEQKKKAESFLKLSEAKPWQTLLIVVGLYFALVAIYYLLPGFLGLVGLELF